MVPGSVLLGKALAEKVWRSRGANMWVFPFI